MSVALAKRTEELRLLGWTQEGATRYAEIAENARLNLPANQLELLIGFLALFSLIVLVIFVVRYLFKENQPKELVKASNNLSYQSNNINKTGINFGYINNPKRADQQDPFITLTSVINFLKDTRVDTSKLIDHLLLIMFLSYELFKKPIEFYKGSPPNDSKDENNFLNQKLQGIELTNRSDEELRDLLQGIELLPGLAREQLIDLIKSNPEARQKSILAERRAFLLSKTNKELKIFLEGVPNISNLRKIKLVEKILSIEFGEDYRPN